MDHQCKKERIALCEIGYDSDTEIPVEGDLLLPDYCPDIVKLLHCRVTPRMSKSQVVGEKCMLEGTADIGLFYVGADGKLQISEHKIPFGKTVSLRNAPQKPLAFCSVRSAYLNGRAVSGRRVDLRGAFMAYLQVISREEDEMIGSARGDGLQLQRRPISCCQFSGELQRRFTLREQMILPESFGRAAAILRHDEKIRVTDWRIAGGKLLLKGELVCEVVCLTEEETVEKTSFILPVSHMAEPDTVMETPSCRVQLSVTEVSLRTKRGEEEEAVIEGEFGLLLRCLSVRESTQLLPVDAYSTRYEVQMSRKNGRLIQQIGGMPIPFTAEWTAVLPEGFHAPCDQWCDASTVQIRPGENELLIGGKLRWCLLGRDKDEMPFCFEQEQELHQTLPLPGCVPQAFGEPLLVLSPVSCRIQEEKAILSAEGTVSGDLYRPLDCTYLTDLTTDHGKTKQSASLCPLTVYYAQPGESLWSIAKEYATSMEAIMEENGLESMQIEEKQAILIPVQG